MEIRRLWRQLYRGYLALVSAICKYIDEGLPEEEDKKIWICLCRKSIAPDRIDTTLKKTPIPENVVYEHSVKELEALAVMETISRVTYGEMPIQIGYCNGHNTMLNALEYHRDSEINIAVEIYASTLHYAPCHVKENGFQVAIVLPKGTNYPLKESHAKLADQTGKVNEDALLAAVNKWLIRHVIELFRTMWYHFPKDFCREGT